MTYQNKLLDKVNEGISQNQEKLIKVDNKLKSLIKSSNQCCLWCIIIAEIVALVLIILFM